MKKIFLSLIAVMACMSINAQVVKVYENGVLSATYKNTASNTVKVVLEEAPRDYVEIGGVKWATMNLGATTVAGSPSTCYGDYYAWGETEPRYTSITISGDGTSASFGGWKDSHSSGYSSSDVPSNTCTTLDAEHDAATQKWGSNWRTPTSADFLALAEACTGSTSSNQSVATLSSSNPTGGIYWLSSSQTYLSEYTGVAGILFVDKTDTSKRVFFPGTGYCLNKTYTGDSKPRYWSSSLHSATNAYRLIGSTSSLELANNFALYYGYTIRPVHNESLLSGKFSVSATKQVQFTKGNLYWDGSAYHFENNQTDYPTSWDASHVDHFYWTNLTDYKSGTADYMPYAEKYKYSSQSSSDKFWCCEENKLIVDGTDGLYTLTKDEWTYLFRTRTNASSLYKCGVTVTNGATSYTGCVIIAPDGYTGELQSSYTLDEVNAAGVVCLPSAGRRGDNSINDVEYYGHYWSATPDPDKSYNAYNLYFPSSFVGPDGSDYRFWGCSLRLVKTVSE